MPSPPSSSSAITKFLQSERTIAAGAIILPNIGGWAGGFITKSNIKPWYEGLKAPAWKPPSAVFGPVWTTLYCGMGYASYVVYNKGGGFSGAAKLPLSLYAAQLALNWAWTPIFFHYHEMKWSVVEIAALTACAAATGLSFYGIDKVAGLIFVPYVAWLAFASYLNYSFYKLNTPAIEEGGDNKKK